MGSEEWEARRGWRLDIGTRLTVVKWAPDGRETRSYPATVVDAAHPPWIGVRATWGRELMDIDGLRFVPGDTLLEFFSPAHPYNVLAVYSPEDELRGWYANVTHPAMLDVATAPPTLVWHDLYVDVVALPDGTVRVRDEDELLTAGVATSDPDLHRLILSARDELLHRFADRCYPFHG